MRERKNIIKDLFNKKKLSYSIYKNYFNDFKKKITLKK